VQNHVDPTAIEAVSVLRTRFDLLHVQLRRSASEQRHLLQTLCPAYENYCGLSWSIPEGAFSQLIGCSTFIAAGWSTTFSAQLAFSAKH
jgi:hypothetical protein